MAKRAGDLDTVLNVDVVTIFPEYLTPLELSLVGKAVDAGILGLSVHDLRDYADDRHRTVDDSPYGGGPGMVMRPDVWGRALDAVLAEAMTGVDQGGDGGDQRGEGTLLVVPSPSGNPFTQAMAAEFARADRLVFACGRYEGIDSRVAEHYRGRLEVREVSVGDVVIAGGEAVVLVVVEAVARLLPGVLGNSESATDDSFAPEREGWALEGPIFTRPPVWRGLAVPPVLLSGDHQAIRAWRAEQSRLRTATVRPELLSDGSGLTPDASRPQADGRASLAEPAAPPPD